MGPFSICVDYCQKIAEVSYSQAQTITIPFEFEPMNTDVPVTPLLLPDFGGVDFINLTGSSTLTVFSILDSLAFLGIAVVIFLAAKMLMWLYTFTTGLPSHTEKLDVSGGFSAAEDVTGNENYGKLGKLTKFSKKIRF
jgi:hypothetical protein